MAITKSKQKQVWKPPEGLLNGARQSGRGGFVSIHSSIAQLMLAAMELRMMLHPPMVIIYLPEKRRHQLLSSNSKAAKKCYCHLRNCSMCNCNCPEGGKAINIFGLQLFQPPISYRKAERFIFAPLIHSLYQTDALARRDRQLANETPFKSLDSQQSRVASLLPSCTHCIFSIVTVVPDSFDYEFKDRFRSKN